MRHRIEIYQARDGMGENPVVTWVGTFDEDDRTIQIQRFVPGQSGNGRNAGVIANISGLAARGYTMSISSGDVIR